MKNYDTFQKLLETIEEPKCTNMFPRPEKTPIPIPSYGIIVVFEDKDSFHYMSFKRRTTVEFSELVKCGPRKGNLYHYFSNMTPTERQLLLTFTHDKLWNDLLLEEKNLFAHSRKSAKNAFETYGDLMSKLLTMTNSCAVAPPHEFPKGRMSRNDKTLLGVAVRELSEETGIELGNQLDIYTDVTLRDAFTGTDGILYQTDYFVVRVPYMYGVKSTAADTGNCIGYGYLSKDYESLKWIKLDKSDNFATSRELNLLPKRLSSLLVELHKTLVSRPRENLNRYTE